MFVQMIFWKQQMQICWKVLTNSAEGSLPAGATAALASRSAVSVLTVSGTSCHQQLWRLHLTLALLRGVGPATVVRRRESQYLGDTSVTWHANELQKVGWRINLTLSLPFKTISYSNDTKQSWHNNNLTNEAISGILFENLCFKMVYDKLIDTILNISCHIPSATQN